MTINWQKYGIYVPTTRTTGQYKTECPFCKHTRKHPHDKSLSLDLETGLFNCHHCGKTGCAAEKDEDEKRFVRPEAVTIKTYSDKVVEYFNSRGISEDTMRKSMITEADVWIPKDNKTMHCIQFNYYHSGDLINTKSRSGSKGFALVQGAEIIPYNIDSVKGAKELIVTEGEFDALSYVEIGCKSVISVPNGANSNLDWMTKFYDEYFAPLETIYVASDNDTKGVELRQELVRRFGSERCRIVDYPAPCKDANDVLKQFGPGALRKTLTMAKDVPVEGVFTVSDFEDELDLLYRNGLQRGYTTGHKALDELISFETKRLCIMTGIPGSGKSEFLDEIAECMNIRYGWKFAYFSPENAPLQIHASKLISKFTGRHFSASDLTAIEYEKVKQHLQDNFFFIYPEQDSKLDTVLEKAKYLVRKHGIKALVIDPYNRLESEMGNRSETLYISQLLDKLTDFAQRNDVLVFLMAHPTKMQKDKDGKSLVPTLYDISGSANFFNKADFGIVVHRNRMEDCTEIHVDKVKFRHLGECGMTRLKYNVNNGRYTDFQEGFPIEWDNSNHLTAKAQESEKKAQYDFLD